MRAVLEDTHSRKPSPLLGGHATTVIALWLSHENTETTQIYIHTDLTIKEQALNRTTPPDTSPGRY